MQCDCTFARVLACLHPRNSISNVVVSLMIHDDIYLFIYIKKRCSLKVGRVFETATRSKKHGTIVESHKQIHVRIHIQKRVHVPCHVVCRASLLVMFCLSFVTSRQLSIVFRYVCVFLRAVAVAVAGFCWLLQCLRVPCPSLSCCLTCWLLAESSGLFFFSFSSSSPSVSLTPPCVHSKRPRVYRHHAHMLKHVRVVPVHTGTFFSMSHHTPHLTRTTHHHDAPHK